MFELVVVSSKGIFEPVNITIDQSWMIVITLLKGKALCKCDARKDAELIVNSQLSSNEAC